VTLGVVIIFLITFDFERDLDDPPRVSRMFIVNYWFILILSITFCRMLFRSIQRALLRSGVGHKRTLIVGWGKRAWELADELMSRPGLGYTVIGFLDESAPQQTTPQSQDYKSIPLLGNIKDVESVASESKAQEVILAMRGNSRRKAMNVVNQCNGLPLNFKIVPDLYDIVIGQARTNQIHGSALIDILPQFMPEWERTVKRIMDIVISAFILIVFLPVWVLLALAIRLESRGPVLYRQTRVGKDCKEFEMYKFRSMADDAESISGPRWAEKKDPRITRVGRLIRPTRIDEIPQFWNVLKGEMSLVGPRPERPHFIDQFKTMIPFYIRRQKIRPGITGWGQIKVGYAADIEAVKEKLQYDLFYLENMSLRMDLKILLNTIHVMLRGKGL
jgi:exopolysaccharide biosynthesis polyprenyl glycosylphosphotransferase